MPRSFDQIRAERAYSVAANCHGVVGFKETAQSFPAMLQTNGLLASVAFLLAKGRDQHTRILRALIVHLGDPIFALRVPTNAAPIDVFRHWVGLSAGQPNVSGADLRCLSDEALSFAGWLKRAAEAYGGGQE